MPIRKLLALFLLLGAATSLAGPPLSAPKGQLVLIGGGEKPLVAMKKFVELAGGPTAPIVVVPTASEDPDVAPYYTKLFQSEHGVADVVVLPIRTREDAGRADLAAQAARAKGIFFAGGDQARITKALLDTPVGRAIEEAFSGGAVVGGTSAGTACQSALMITGEGDFKAVRASVVEMTRGLGFFRGVVVDQHFVARQRLNRLLSVILEHPDLVGVGVDEDTAVWVKPDGTFEVLGDRSVIVLDAKGAALARKAVDKGSALLGVHDLKLHVLVPGEGYDPARRIVLPAGEPMKRAAPALLLLLALPLGAAEAPGKLTFDQSRSVQNRRIRPAEPAEKVDWPARITGLLREEPGDVVVTAVGDMIFNEQISRLQTPQHQQLFRILQEADIAYGNLEFSLNAHPEAQRPFYNFRADPEFAWELAAIGINMVSMANNHALDFGPEGLRDCLKALDRAQITHAGAGMTLADARAVGSTGVQAVKTKFGLLSYVRYWTSKYRCKDPNGACLATINPAVILVAGKDGKVEPVEGLVEGDVKEMEDDVVLAKRHEDVVMVSLHNHDRSHHRAHGIQDTTPANDEVMFRRAVDAGGDVILGTGPHVIRGIEIYKGKPILYSLSNFIYQYRTPDRIPVDLIHQRDSEIDRPANVSVWDRRDPRRIFEGVVARMTFREAKLKRLELIPFSIDDEGPLYGVPRLASGARAREIIEVLQKLSAPYGTTIVDKGWYAEVKLP